MPQITPVLLSVSFSHAPKNMNLQCFKGTPESVPYLYICVFEYIVIKKNAHAWLLKECRIDFGQINEKSKED